MSIRQRGKNSWEITIPLGTDPVTGKHLRGYHSFKGSKRQVLEEQTRLLHERDSGLHVQPSRMTVAELLDDWLKSCSGLAPKTRAGYAQIVNSHLKPALGTLKLKQLRPTNIQRYLNEKAGPKDPGEKRLSSTTLHHHYAVLHAALRYAVRMQLLCTNACDAINAPKVRRTEMTVLNASEVAELLLGLMGKDVYIPVVIAVYTGLRRGEVLGLKWGDLDLENGRLTLTRSLQRLEGVTSFKSPKNERGRTISIAPFLVGELRMHYKQQLESKMAARDKYEDNDLVCARPDGTPLNPGSYSSRFRDLVDKMDVPRIRLHDLRHIHATLLLDGGVSLKVVSERLGHSTTRLTGDTYAHILEGRDRAASDLFDSIMCEALGEAAETSG